MYAIIRNNHHRKVIKRPRDVLRFHEFVFVMIIPVMLSTDNVTTVLRCFEMVYVSAAFGQA